MRQAKRPQTCITSSLLPTDGPRTGNVGFGHSLHDVKTNAPGKEPLETYLQNELEHCGCR